MATFKAEVYAHQKRADGTYNIKIRVIHKTKKKYISSPFYVFKEDLTRSLKLKNQYYIDECNKIIKKYISICSQLGEGINYMDVDQVVEYIKKNNFNSYTGFDLDVVKYTRDYIAQLKQDGNKGNASTYEVMINNLIKFVGRDKISVNEITVKFINDWINWIKNQPAPSNKSKGERAQSLYPSNLRAIYNRIKNEYNDEDFGDIKLPNSPFSKIKLPKTPITKKRALDIDTIRNLVAIEYKEVMQPGFNRFNLAKDMFMLSFALIGMNAIDLYECTDCKDGRITYNRHKTKNRRSDKAEISIRIQPEIEGIIEKYRDKTGDRVFNFYKHYSTSQAFSTAINYGLKRIGNLLGVDSLQFYSARHSWATIAANDACVDKYVVHSALNHVVEEMKVTDIYIKKSWTPIDDANRKVLDLVKLDLSNIEEKKYINSRGRTI